MAEKKKSWVCLWIVLYLWAWITPADADADYAKQGCNDRCGDVIVPYPFGIRDLFSAKNQSFLLNCSHATSDSSPPATLFSGNIPITNVSVQDSTMVGSIFPAFDCYDGVSDSNHFSQGINLTGTPFTFSNTRNKFTAVGCDAVAIMGDSDDNFGGGCLSMCKESQNFTNGSSCSGVGCCETPLPNHLKDLQIDLFSLNNHTTHGHFSPYSYAFLVDTSPDSLDLPGFNLFSTTVPQLNLTRPVVLDWVFSSDPHCDQACADNADCIYSDNGRGYNCKCREGYDQTTNPYLSQGCPDIDECKKPDKYPCHGRCKNTMGNYTCDCPFGMKGDGRDSCQLAVSVKITSVVGSIIILSVFILLIIIICKRRKKLTNFIKNGGMMLKHQRVRIFSKAELEKATQNFDNAKLLGEGGFGSVYKGVLEGNLQIAVKKPKDENKIEVNKDFHHEINTVSQVNHKNVVKLLGLCLETKVPLLVYEYVSNGSLFQLIHDKRSSLLRSWKNRLRVAAETALALDYLHSLADPPIIHRDVKTMNILLDENHRAKVSDFGASVLISPGENTIGANVQGTLGYIDPEYLMTGILTDKSDVYSFGVVLVELLTGEKPTSSERSGEKRNMIQYFISVAESKDVLMILGFDVRDEAEKEEIGEVAELAKRCLHASGIKRPKMKEVAEELASLMKLNQRFWAQQNDTDETEHLLGESSDSFAGNEKAKSQMGEQYSYTDHQTSFDIESISMPSI